MKVITFLFCLFACQLQAQTTTVLISIDGFAAHYLEEFKPKNMLALADKGIVTSGLIPSFPTKTFANHLTLVTGKVPFEHGIVLNKFYDKKTDDVYSYGNSKKPNQWLKYPPIWTILEQKNIPTAIYFWPESDKSYQGIRPTYYRNYDGKVPNSRRFKKMLEWLNIQDKSKPQLIVGYFSTIDSAGHQYGRDSKELKLAIEEFDQLLGDFVGTISTQVNSPVNIILVSDHGMVKIDKKKALLKSNIIPQWMNSTFKIIMNDSQIFIYNLSKDQKLIDQAYNELESNHIAQANQYDLFKKGNYPAYWKVTESLSFVPDIILSAIPPATFTNNLDKISAETHGFETKYTSDLDGIFIAAGPDFKEKTQIKSFSNTEVFKVLSRLFSLDQESADDSIVNNILK
ncbi:ectonucleotide pyrophosphatase/phosphodiesterase [Thalassotalea piscium]